MSAHIRVRDLTMTFTLSEGHGRPLSLIQALRGESNAPRTRQVHALDGVSLDIAEGERVGIIGRNGAGKTTLLSMLAGIATPTSGTIDILGDVHAVLTIGAVLRDEATGRENIYLDGLVHNKSRSEVDARAQQIIDFSELAEFIDRPVHTYSSGMKARLAFSMIAFIQPDILIIDETLSVGDAKFSVKAGKRMREIAREGRIVVLVSHGLASIVEMCTRCIWMDQGRIVMDGPPEEVTRAYEAAVTHADEEELRRKFGREADIVPRSDIGALHDMSMIQNGLDRGGSYRTFEGILVKARGVVGDPAGLDIVVSLLRADGRRIFTDRLTRAIVGLPTRGAFELELDMTPMLLAAGLYRLSLTLEAVGTPVSQISRAFEIVDEVGHKGGQPLMLHPPRITSRRIERASTS